MKLNSKRKIVYIIAGFVAGHLFGSRVISEVQKLR